MAFFNTSHLFSAVLVGAGVIAASLGVPLEALAQNDYVPIQEVPNVIGPTTSFADFVNGLFWFAVVGGAMLAVIMISIGGFQYMGGESVFSKEEGIKRIQDAVLGLILILLTVVIFSTINPDILDINLDIKEVTPERLDTTPNNNTRTQSAGEDTIPPGASNPPTSGELGDPNRDTSEAGYEE